MFLKKISTLMTGTILGQLTSFLLLPILTKLYGPVYFGEFGLFITITSFLSILVTLRLEQIIVLNSRRSLIEAFTSTIVVIPIMALLLFISLLALDFLFLTTKYFYYIAIVAASFLALNLSCFQYFVAIDKVRVASFVTSSLVILSGMTQLVLSYFDISFNGLIVGYVVAVLAVSILFSSLVVNKYLDRLPSISIIRKYIVTNKHYSLYGLPQGVINSLSQSLPILIISGYFSSMAAGFYFLAIKVVQLPLSLISGNFRALFIRELAILQEKNLGLSKFLQKFLLKLFVIGFLGAFAYYFVADTLFEFVFGTGWNEASKISKVLIWWVTLGFISTPSHAFLYSMKKVKLLLIYEFLLLLFRGIALVYGVYYESLFYAILGYSLVGVCFNFTLIIYSIYIAHNNDNNQLNY